MNIRSLILIVTLCCTSLLISCEKDKKDIDSIQASLQNVADSVYRVFDEKWDIDKSGIFIQITGPSGSYMASANITPTLTPASHFRIASITKTFTAAAIMLLQQEGKLNIDDTITKYLPNTATYNIPYKSEITIKQLLQHRAGVFDITNNPMPETIDAPYAGMKYVDYIRDQDDFHTFTFDELIGLNAEYQLSKTAPGVEFNYSNTGYNILGVIIETLSGLTYSDFITQKFINPLGLTNTYSVWQGNEITMRSP